MGIEQLQPVFVDVQASGMPGSGTLLELAWAVAGDPVLSLTVRTPAGKPVPDRVRAITGLTVQESSSGVHVTEAAHIMRRVLSLGRPVAHHALYEGKWLGWLTGMPLEGMACTRELAGERLPGLGAYSIRAVAGYLGWALPELRRARDHVEATRFIWERMPQEPDPGRSRVSRETRLAAPGLPGVYEMHDARGGVLYVGTSGNIRARLSSWFTGGGGAGVRELVARTHGLCWTLCPDAFSASVLEARKILELDPPCNRAGRLTGEKAVYLGDDWRISHSPPAGPFRGPFPSEGSVGGLVLARRLLDGEEPGEYGDFLQAFRDLCGRRSLFRVGLEHYRVEPVEHPTPLHRLVQGVVHGSLMARRGALLRLLRGCTVSWTGGVLREPLDWPEPEGELKLLPVLLAGLRKLSRNGLAPRIGIPCRAPLSPDQIQALLRVV